MSGVGGESWNFTCICSCYSFIQRIWITRRRFYNKFVYDTALFGRYNFEWAALISFIIQKGIRAAFGIHISKQNEIDGVEVAKNGERTHNNK